MIVAATLSDARDCSKILQEWIDVTDWYPNLSSESVSEASMENRMETGAVLLMKSDGETVGFVSFSGEYLDCLYLRKSSQNKGYGLALLNEVKRASQGKLALWVLAQNHGASRFYQREGFIETSRGDGSDNEDNLPDIGYEWNKETSENG